MDHSQEARKADDALCQHQHCQRHSPSGVQLDGTGDNQELAPEKIERRHAADRHGANDEGQGRHRHPFSQTAEMGDAPRAGGVGNRAHGQEQEALGEGVADQVKQAATQGNRRPQGAHGESQHHVAKVRDGGVGQQPLQIVLHRILQYADVHGDDRHGAEQQCQLRRKHRRRQHQSRHQVNARLHHGCGVQIRRGRRRRRHRARQPRLKWELRGLAKGRNRQEDDHEGLGGGRQQVNGAEGKGTGIDVDQDDSGQ